jgi:hypothetical protein
MSTKTTSTCIYYLSPQVYDFGGTGVLVGGNKQLQNCCSPGPIKSAKNNPKID